MANKTVDSDATFKTYVEGLPAYASGTVYMNDDSKYWTFNKQATDKVNAMCVKGDDIEIWVYDGTDWITNRIPEVVDSLTGVSTIDALSANQGKALNNKINEVKNNSGVTYNDSFDHKGYCKMPDGTLIQWGTKQGIVQADTTFTFSIPFISYPTVIASTGAGSVRVPVYVESVSNSSFELHFDTYVDRSKWGRWLAIGRWK